ncbi:MAG: DEAD/DEAH box helicase family protein [Tepidisphaera sp.]
MTTPTFNQVPIQPVDKPILCSPYEPPLLHWHCDRTSGVWTKAAGRRPSRYWYKTKDDVAGQMTLTAEGLSEGQDDLHMVNQLREDVARWRDSQYEGVTPVTRELLRWWASPDRARRLFFCQREAVETVIYLAEIIKSGRRPRFNPEFLPGSLSKLIDASPNPDLLPLARFGCKMATGSGKTVVMSMLISWAFCNRGRNPSDERFPSAVLVCCPNLTVKERLQVLRPERADNYYGEFDIVPAKLRPLMQNGRVIVENWHQFAPQSEHHEGGKSYAVVNKGTETPEAFARRVLGDLYDRLPVMVLNDEAHHCYRPAPLTDEAKAKLTPEELKEAQSENEEARIWLEGLDKINNYAGGRKTGQPAPGIAMCVDLSATPFYIGGSGYTEGSPFPWLVSDFGLVDAIESGIVKIPRLPVIDSTGQPEPKYFRLWHAIKEKMKPGEFLAGRAKKPKPEVIYREAEPALKQLAGQWVEKFNYMQEATDGQDRTPPVLILVCDNVDVAELFYRKISGEEPIEAATAEDVAEVESEEDADGDEDAPKAKGKAKGKGKPKVSYGHGAIFPAYFANEPGLRRTLRIDNDLLSKAESEDPTQNKQQAAEALRKVVATVGKRGQPGEHIRCVVSVAMLTEGWDANNVTHIFGIRAFGSQLLCEQVVGRGLRRMNYTPDKETGLLPEEYVDIYGIPFSVIPFKGRVAGKEEPDDRPLNHVRALPERAAMEIRFPVVEGYAFALQKNRVKCDVPAMEPMEIEPEHEPTATFLRPTVGYEEGAPSNAAPFGFERQDRRQFYAHTHLQAIKFQIARLIVARLSGVDSSAGEKPVSDAKLRVFRLRSRHQLFPQVLRFVDDYVRTKVDFRGGPEQELGMEKYVQRMVGYFCDAIEPDEAEGEPPLMPIPNRYKAEGTSGDVDFWTKRPVRPTNRSHVNQVVLDSVWEASTEFWLEASEDVDCYVRNDHLGLVIPYEFQGLEHSYTPDFIVRLKSGVHVLLETKGRSDAQVSAKHQAAQRWVSAVNNAGKHGRWAFRACYDPQRIPEVLEIGLVHG